MCINDCGPMEKVDEKPGLYGHALLEVAYRGDPKNVFLNMNSGFTVLLYKCSKCGYMEMYDAPPVPGQG